MPKISDPIPRRLILATFLALLAAASLKAFSVVGGYAYACHLESRWSKADPKTKAELEKYLSLYSEKVIDQKKSLWGHDYKMAGNERMVQYMILGSAPLDVVYDNRDIVKMIYTSYE